MNAFKISELKDKNKEVKILSMRKIGEKNYIFTDLCVIESDKETLLNYKASIDKVSGVYTFSDDKGKKVELPIKCKLSDLK